MLSKRRISRAKSVLRLDIQHLDHWELVYYRHSPTVFRRPIPGERALNSPARYDKAPYAPVAENCSGPCCSTPGEPEKKIAMPEALKCPTCSAPLEYPANGGPTAHCPYCNSTVLLPGNLSPAATNNIADLTANMGPFVNEALKLAQASQLLRSGKKIEAIKVYRQTFNVDLVSAKKAVEDLGSGRPVTLNPTEAGAEMGSRPAASGSSFKTGLGLAVFLTAVIGFIVFMAVRGARNQVKSHPAFVPPTLVLPSFQLAATPVPTFAHMALEFGSEGMGAGQFKDARSIAIDGAGHIYVGDYSDGRVQVFDAQGKFLHEWNIGANKSLMSLTASHDGIVYAVAPGNIFCYEGSSGRMFGQAQGTDGDNQETYFDAFATLSGDIYAISESSQIVILNSDGQIKSKFNANEKVGEDVDFQRIMVNGEGEIYALDRTKGIFKFAADGRYINRFGSTDGTGPDRLISPNGLAVDGQGRLYVSDSGTAIHVFDGQGRYLDSFGDDDVVFGIAINDQNEIFACYRNKNVIRKFVVDKH